MTINHIKDLIPDPRNARAHTPRNVGMIEAALGEVGAARSIVIDEDGVVLAGNATIEAAAQAGIEKVQVVDADGNTIIAVRRSGLTPEQKTRLALYDNRAAELADWDAGVLAALAEETDLSQLFRDEELAALLAQEAVDIGGAGDEFDTTPEDGPTRTQTGDLWIIGEKHRLLVGDCTDAANVERLMGGERAGAVVTDPPYGIEWDTNYTRFTSGYDIPRRRSEPIANDDKPFDPTLWLSYPTVILFGANYFAHYLPVGTWLVWDKRHSNGTALLSDAELAWMNKNKGVYIYSQTWQGVVRSEEILHPTQKPTKLLEWCFDKGDIEQGAIVLDPFLGSGTTLIAAHQTGRRCYGMEISCRYADVILRRAEAAGLTCTLAGRANDE